MCFQNDGKSAQTDNCVKSRIMTKVVDYVLSVDKFEQQFFLPKCLLQLPRLKDHMNTIGIDQSLISSAIFEHICLKNNNKLYKHSGKCENQQQFKYII